MTIKVDDVDAAYEEAQRRVYEVVHPFTDEPWGIRRFVVRSPDGHVINIASTVPDDGPTLVDRHFVEQPQL